MTLEVEGLAFSHGKGKPDLEAIGFALDAGEVLCLLGPNGAGKTTLMRCLTRGLTPRAGRVSLGGKDIATLAPRELARQMAYVPQATQPAFGHTVLEMVLMGRSAHLGRFDMPSRADLALSMDALDRVGIVHLAERSFGTVSGGERQLCLLARALAQEAPILLLDEPAASLDFGNQARILGITAALARDGFGILMTTHHPDHALQIGHRFLALKAGRLHGSGPVAALAEGDYLSRLYGTGVQIIRSDDGRIACLPVLAAA